MTAAVNTEHYTATLYHLKKKQKDAFGNRVSMWQNGRSECTTVHNDSNVSSIRIKYDK